MTNLNKDEVFIVIPAYNVAESVGEVVAGLRQQGFNQIVVTEDGSTRDNTYEVLQKVPGIYLLKHTINRGQGAALQTGQSFALDHGAKYIVHFDSDGQHPVDEIENLLAPLISGNYDIALGSRFIGEQKSNVPLKKKILLRVGILITWFISGIWLTDTHNGFRAMTADAARKIKITMDRFEHPSEMLDLIKFHHLRYKEVPVTITYTDYSKLNGQKISNSINIVLNTVSRKLSRILLD
jgi:glycosyltransferase involved in cell wall biosynthesis